MRPSRALLLVLLLATTHGAAYLTGTSDVAQDILAPEPSHVPGTRTAEANIVAVTSGGEGNVGSVEVTIAPGHGRILLDTNPFIETDTQLSARDAARAAARITSTTLTDRDVTYSFDIRGTHLGGPSAGAAMTVATVAAIRNTTVRRDAAVTGTIRPDGRIGRVGGVLEKAVAAGENDFSILLVPRDQTVVTYYRRVEGGDVVNPSLVLRDEEVTPVRIDVNQETTRRFDMETRGIRTARDAVDILVTQR